MAKIITAYLRDLTEQVEAGEITYGCMVELLNEKAAQPVDSSHSDKDVQDKMYSIIHEEITQVRIKIDPMLNDHKNYNNADDIIADSIDKIFEKLAVNLNFKISKS